MNEAEVLQLGDSVGLPQMLARYPGRRGVATLRAILADADIGATITRSQLEERFLAFIDRYGLPRPICNQPLILKGREFQPHCMWPNHRLIVELDSRTFHETAVAFEDDRERDRILQAAGWRVIRVT